MGAIVTGILHELSGTFIRRGEHCDATGSQRIEEARFGLEVGALASMVIMVFVRDVGKHGNIARPAIGKPPLQGVARDLRDQCRCPGLFDARIKPEEPRHRFLDLRRLPMQ